MAAAHPTIAAALARTRFPTAGSAVVCGVSGGADSLALLVLAVAAGLDVTAVHVDHGLRPDSTADASVVEHAASALGAAFRTVRVDVGHGPDLEARARSVRHEALGPDALLGHTADDQVETMVLALLRGAGLDGLAGMRPERRPLLDLRRTDTEAVVRAAGLDFVVDPTNSDPRFRRNRVRHDVVPLLADVAERDVVPVVARQAALLRDDAEYLAAQAASIDPTDCAELTAAPVVLARRAIRRWLAGHDDELHPPDAASVERVLGVAAGVAVACHVTGGWEVRRSAGRLRVARPTPKQAHVRTSPADHLGSGA